MNANQVKAEVSRLNKAVEVLQGEAKHPFITPEIKQTLLAAAIALQQKADVLTA